MHSPAALFARLAARKTKRTPGTARTPGDNRVTGQAAPSQDRPRCVAVVRAPVPRRAVSQSAITAAHHPRQKENSEQPLRALRGSHAKKSALKVIPVFL